MRFNVGEELERIPVLLRGSYLAVGANNLLNRAPQYSDFFGGHLGYDPLQADILGRLLYVQIGSRW